MSFRFYLISRLKRLVSKRSTVTLNTVVISAESGGFTGFFEEFPEIIAEGETIKEVRSNLFKTLEIVLDHKRTKSNANQPIVNRPKKHFHHTLEFTP
jgi:predicted RNase H-like HicB family nuclease